MSINRTLLSLFIFSFDCSAVRAVETPTDNSAVLAKVGDQTLTEAQMRKDLAYGLYEAENSIYAMKKNWIDQKAQDYLFNKAAKDAKMSRAAWEKREIDDKLAPITDQEIDQMTQMMTRGQMPTDPAKVVELKNQARQYLMSQRRGARQSALYAQLVQATPVQISLQPPAQPDIQVTYTKDNPVKGPKDAPVTVMEFIDYQCPPCKGAQPYIRSLESQFPGKVKLVVRHFPLVRIHPQAMPSAKAAICAQEQGKFWALHDKMYDNQSELSDEARLKWAKDLGLNTAKFNKCIASDKPMTLINADMAEGMRYGVQGTPTIFMNGNKVNPAELANAIKAELEKKKS